MYTAIHMHSPQFKILIIVLAFGLVVGLSLFVDTFIHGTTIVFEKEDEKMLETSASSSPPVVQLEEPEETTSVVSDSSVEETDLEDIGVARNAVEDPDDSLGNEENNEDSIPPIVEITEPLSQISFADINLSTREAIVNILCTTNAIVPFGSISGSGVIIDPSGIIITNAHIAQYYLLKDYPIVDGVTCVIRTGSPARHMYVAELLYISEVWIEEHAGDIIKEKPTGTGENDFALLRITGRTLAGQEPPNTFAYVEPSVGDRFALRNQNVLIAGYPAGFLGGTSIQKTLYAVSTIVQIKEIFTFSENLTDLISFGGNIAAQQGASGSAIVDENNHIIGVVVTSTDAETTSERDLRAITFSHIDRALLKETGSGLLELLSEDAAVSSALFQSTRAPSLTELLLQAIE